MILHPFRIPWLETKWRPACTICHRACVLTIQIRSEGGRQLWLSGKARENKREEKQKDPRFAPQLG